MVVYGFDSIANLLQQQGFQFKLLANEAGIVFFPRTTEHRDAGQPGIRYADDSQGNALAAMVSPGSIDFRFHRDFTEQRVVNLMVSLLRLPELEFARTFTITYQASPLRVPPSGN